MRRRDHERIVAEMHRQIIYLQRQNDQLIDKILYVTGTPWTPPPMPDQQEPEPDVDYLLSPEHEIDAFAGVE